MKKNILFILLAVCTLFYANGAEKDGQPQITFAEDTHDFGTIKEDGGNVSYEFTFTNTGDAPLLIVNATASCGCTRPSFPKKPVAPGKSEKIKVTYVPVNRPGEFNKTVTVRTNAKKQKKVTLKIKGFVQPKS